MIVTSRYYVEELKTLFKENESAIASIESYFDLFYFSAREVPSRCCEIKFFNDLKQKFLKLRSKYILAMTSSDVKPRLIDSFKITLQQKSSISHVTKWSSHAEVPMRRKIYRDHYYQMVILERP